MVRLEVEVEHPVGVLVGEYAGRLHRERRLPDARRAFDDEYSRRLPMLAGQLRQFLAAADEFHCLERKRLRRSRQSRAPSGGLGGKVPAAAQYLLVEFRQRRAWFRALLVD